MGTRSDDMTNFAAVLPRRTLLKAVGATAAVGIAPDGTRAAGAKRPLVYAYANWSDDLAITFIGAQLLQQKYGYRVTPLMAEVAIIYASLQSGKVDAYSAGYLQGLEGLKGVYRGGQSAYVKKIANSIDIVGVSEGPMTQGLAVPDYVTIRSVEQLNGNAGKFNHRIIGIDPGSGLMRAADQAVKEYGLTLDLVAGSEAAMEAAFRRAYGRKEWIVVTSWQPLPMWSQFKMKYLADPKHVLMPEPYYDFHIVRKDLKTNFPQAYTFFSKYHLPNDEEAKVMGWIDAGMQPADAATKWIKENQGKGLIEKWVS